MKKAKKRDAPPPQLVCTITGKLMKDPWTDAQGNRYDGPTIHTWIDRYGVSPITGEIMTRNDIFPDPSLKALVENYRPSTKIYQDFDSPKKKLMKLVKYSYKAVKSATGVAKSTVSLENTDAPDYDAIVRFRALQLSKQQNVSSKNIGVGEAIFEESEANRILLANKNNNPTDTNDVVESDFSVMDAPSNANTSNAEDQLPKVTTKKKKKKTVGIDDRVSEQPQDFDSRSEVSSVSDARSQQSSRSLASKKSRGSRNWSPADEITEDPRNARSASEFGAIEEGDENLDSEDDEEGQEWINPPANNCEYGIWTPLKSLWEILLRDHTIRPALGESAFCMDCIVCIGLLWCLVDSINAVFGLRLEGYNTWLDTDGGTFVRLIYSGYNTLATSVLLFSLGYYVPNIVFNTIQVDASKQNRYLMFTTYVKGMIPMVFEAAMKISPVIWTMIIIALIYGAASYNDKIVQAEYYSTCSKSWWTNIFFVTNFYVMGTANRINETLSYSSNYDSESVSMELEYADIGVCYPSLWLVSCACQLCLLSLPLVYLYLEYPTAAINATYFCICLTVLLRIFFATTISSPADYAGLIYYSPWGRADAFCFGLRLFMNEHIKFISPVDGNRSHANRDIGLIQLFLWSCWGLVPKQISYREFRSRRRRASSVSETASVSETSSLLGTKKKSGGKKKKAAKPSRPYETLDDRSGRTRDIEEGYSRRLLDDDVDDSRSIFSQLTSDSYRFPSTISYMARAYEEADLGDDMTDADRSVYSYESAHDMTTPVPMYWTACLKFLQVTYYVSIFAGCLYWTIYSFTINSSYGDTRPDWFLFSEWQFRNCSLFVVALGTYMLASLAVSKSIPPLSYVMGMDIWHPFASMAFCFYITQLMSTNMMCSLLYSSLGFEWNSATVTESRGSFVIAYIKVFLANLIFAMLLSIFVERPVMLFVSKYLMYSSMDRL